MNDDAALLRRARWATRVQFLALGVFSGVWGAHIPSVKARYALNEGTLALVLLTAAIGSIAVLLVAGRVVARLGACNATVFGGVTMSAALACIVVLPGFALLLPVAFVLGAGACLLDVAMNTEGSELEHRSGRAVMSNLHGMFSTGGMLGAALVGLLLGLGWSPAQQVAVVAALLALGVVAASRGMLASHGAQQGEGEATAHFAWPRGTLLVIGLLILAGLLSEGVMYDWCVLYLHQELGLAQAQAALGYSAFAGAMALSRFGGDWLRERFSEVALLRSGALLAALAMAVALLSRSAGVAMVCFALVGAGLAPVAPILFNASTRVPGVSRAAAIASVTSIGYSGFMIGPPLIGALARASSLTAALSVVVVGALLLAASAGRVPAKPAE